jgi:hypothetical protein
MSDGAKWPVDYCDADVGTAAALIRELYQGDTLLRLLWPDRPPHLRGVTSTFKGNKCSTNPSFSEPASGLLLHHF